MFYNVRMGKEQLFELRRRTFNTPHFRGMEFIEVEAKSIINHVPGNHLPFNYTINPYRGCSHSCSYCLGGDTPILMANGRTRPIADIRAGDRIYGTHFDGKYRRYVTTDVLDHWSTVKEAYLVSLEDGTQLLTSGDHRFLASHRGWKHVMNTPAGAVDRAHLTSNDKLLGLGCFPGAPRWTEAYRRGYLCGLLRGDAHIGSHSYLRAGSGRFRVAEVHQFRLALVDFEALKRARDFLRHFDVETDEYVFHRAVGDRKEIRAITNRSRYRVELVRSLVAWPRSPNRDWCKGFLGGIFDAEGSFSQGIWRVSNTDGEIIDRIISCLSRFGFSYTLESPKRKEGLKPIQCVRILGGLHERMRFFLTVDPAITRKRGIEGFAIKSKAKLKIVSIEPLGIDMPMYDITTGTGDFIANGVVSHNCFARPTHTYLDMDAGRDFETKIVVKVNAGERLKKELRAKRWKGEHIAMGTATDPYQRAEGKYRLMPQIIGALSEVGNPFSILTKGTLILRDLELLQDAAEVADVSTAFSIGTLDEDAWRKSEPGTPHPRKRIEAVAKLNDAGIPCGVMLAPILPGITDDPEQLRAVVTAAVAAGATHVSPILLHLRPVVKDVFMAWLEETYPELVARYQSIYKSSAYGPKGEREKLGANVSELLKQTPLQKNRLAHRRFRRRSRRAPAEPKSEQLKLL